MIGRLAVREMGASRLRVALSALAVVLGVAFVTGTLVLSDTINRSFDRVFAQSYSGTAVIVRGTATVSASDREPVPASALAAVRATPGVRAAEGVVSGTAEVVGRDGDVAGATGAPRLGYGWIAEPALNPFRLREGAAPRGPGEVVLDARTARAEGIGVGDRVTVVVEGGRRAFRASGIAGYGAEDSLAGATTVLFHSGSAADLLGAGRRYEEIRVLAEPGTDDAELATRIQGALAPGYEAVTGRREAADQSGQVKDELGILRVALLAFALISLFVAAFIISNSFAITVAQRTRQLALFRAVGAAPGQVTRLVLLEAALIGLIGSVAGIALGVAVAGGLRSLLQASAAALPGSGLVIAPRTVVVGVALGMVVTLVAALRPARRAGRVPPAAALRDGIATPEPSALRRRLVAGSVTLVGLGAVLAGLAGDVPGGPALLAAGALVLFVGVALAAAEVAGPLARALGWPLARLSLPGRLGRENAMRNPRRTAQTASALMIGLALVSFASVFAASLSATVRDTVEGRFTADVVVRSQAGAAFTARAATTLARQPGVGVVSEWRTAAFRDGATVRDIAASDPATIAAVYDVGLESGSVAALARPGTVLVQRDLAEERGLEVGDRITAVFARTGKQTLVVGGTYVNGDFAPVLTSLATYDRNVSPPREDVVVLARARPGASPAEIARARAAVEAAFPGLVAQSEEEYVREVQGQVDQLLTLVSALLGLAVLIAVFGIVNTLALSVVERTREIGLLRAVGLDRRGVRRMVRAEAVVVAVLGGVLGLALGVGLGALVVAQVPEVDVLAVPLARLAGFLVVAALAGVVAAAAPARRAARLDVLRAIAAE